MNNVSNSNAYAPNFNGFIRFSNIKKVARDGVEVIKDMALNTRHITETRPLSNGTINCPYPLGASIKTINGAEYEIPPRGLDGSNFYRTLMDSLREAENKGFSELYVNA